MTTVSAGSSATIFAGLGMNVTITPGSGGRASVNGRNQDGSAITPREIYSATSVTIPAGGTLSIEAVGNDTEYTQGALDTASAAALAASGTLAIGTYSTLDLLAAVSTSSYPTGVRALVGPDSNGQYSEWYSNGVRWRPRSGILAMKNTSGSVSDTVSTEQDVYSVVIPASLIGPNDEVYIEHLWQWPNSATNKTVRVKFGGTVIGAVTATTSASGRGNSHIYMRDSKTAQIFSNSTSALGWSEGNSSSSAPVTATINTDTDITISATGQWGTSGAGSNLITLERITVGIKFAY